MPSVPRPAGRRSVYLVIAICTALGAFLRFYQLTRPGYLLGAGGYDDGVDFGNALRLVSGVIPYRDFVSVQPPGMTVLIAPVAALAKVTGTAWGLGIARLLTAGADTACVALLGLIVRHRGLAAAGVASGIYAIYPDALIAARTFMLEPWLNLFCLIGLLLVLGNPGPGPARNEGGSFPSPRSGPGSFRSPQNAMAEGWRLALGGAVFGFAVAVKLWAVAPLALLILLAARDWRRLATLSAGAVAGLAIPVLPFLVLAPGTMMRDVVISQYVRSGLQHAAPLPRLTDLTGITALLPGAPAGLTIAVLIVAGAAIAAGYIAARRLPADADRPASRQAMLDLYALLGLLVVLVMLLWSTSYHPHYGAFAGPFIALAVALPIGMLFPVAPSGDRMVPALVVGLVAAVAVLSAGTRQFARETSLHGPADLAAQADRQIPSGACVFTNDVSFTIGANRFFSAAPGCPVMIDSFGTLLAMTDGHWASPSRQQVDAVNALVRSSLSRASYAWIEPGQIDWTRELRGYFDGNFRLIGLANSPATPGAPAGGLYIRR